MKDLEKDGDKLGRRSGRYGALDGNHRKDNRNRCHLGHLIVESMWTNITDGRNTKHLIGYGFANYLAEIYFKRLCFICHIFTIGQRSHINDNITTPLARRESCYYTCNVSEWSQLQPQINASDIFVVLFVRYHGNQKTLRQNIFCNFILYKLEYTTKYNCTHRVHVG